MNPLSGVIAEAWAMYRAHAGHLLTIAFVIYVVASVLQALVAGLLGVVGILLAAIIGITAAFLLQAALVTAVEDIRDGQVDLSFGDTLRAARPAVVRVAVASILAGIAIGLGFVAFIVPGLLLMTIWSLIVPVLVIERAGIGEAFGRSRNLVRGFGWNVFGTMVAVFLLLLVANIVIGLLLLPLPDAASQFLASVLSGTLVAPFLALVVTLGYHRLRAAHSSAPHSG